MKLGGQTSTRRSNSDLSNLGISSAASKTFKHALLDIWPANPLIISMFALVMPTLPLLIKQPKSARRAKVNQNHPTSHQKMYIQHIEEEERMSMKN